MKKINKKLLTAIAALMLFTIVSVFVLMLYPLYGHALTSEMQVEIPFYMTIDGKEIEYTKIETLPRDSFIVPFIKGEKLEVEERYGIWNVYRWKIAPESNSEYLLFELNDERIEFLKEHSINGEEDWKSTVIFIGKRVDEE